MAKYKGTNGDDVLIGTDEDDVFTPRLGLDSIDGRGGFDRLVLEYAKAGLGAFGTIDIAGTTMSGTIVAGDDSAVQFENIEAINYIGTAGADDLTVRTGPYGAAPADLQLDGGAGLDRLTIDAYSLLGPLKLKVDASGTATSNVGKFIGWEDYDITVFGRIANAITLGSGDDVVRSINGGGKVYGGDGTDAWIGDYSSEASSLRFISLAGKVENTRVETPQLQLITRLYDFEDMTFTGSASNDYARISVDEARSYTLDGGLGHDTCDIGYKVVEDLRYIVDVTETGEMVGTVRHANGSLLAFAQFFEDVRFQGSDSGNAFSMDASSAKLDQDALGAIFNGGSSVDTLLLDLRGQDATTVTSGEFDTVDQGGEAFLTSGSGFNYWEVFWAWMDDVTVLLGAQGDTAFGDGYYLAALDGGGGIDTLTFERAEVGVNVSLATTAYQNTGDGTVAISGFERLIGSDYNDVLVGSGGNDVITGGLGVDAVGGGAGGADRFVFRSIAESSPISQKGDVISDFAGATGDLIDLAAIDANTNSQTFNDAFTFIGSTAFTGVAGQLRAYSVASGLFYVAGDTNGDKVADIGIYVQSHDAAITAGDFAL